MTADRTTMDRILAYVAIAALTAAAVIFLSGFGPLLAYDEDPSAEGAAVMAKADRLPPASGNCLEQDWPIISSDCLRQPTGMEAATNVRLVTPR